MGDTQQTRSAGTRAVGAAAAAELAEVGRLQERVITAVLVPLWYWWAMAAGMVAIGAARDSRDRVVLAIAIPLAVLVMVVATAAMVPEARRRVQVQRALQPGPRAAAAIVGLVVLVNAVTIAVTSILTANRVVHPFTIGYAAGAAVLVIAGPLVNSYLRMCMRSQARRRLVDASQDGSTP